VERFCRRGSTEIPIVGASLRAIPASYYIVRTYIHMSDSQENSTFNSVRVKPRPARTRRLYLMVGHRTIGLNLSTGRGATAAAFERRALRRLSFRPGYSMLDPPARAVNLLCDLPGRSELGLVVANPFGNLDTVSNCLC